MGFVISILTLVLSVPAFAGDKDFNFKVFDKMARERAALGGKVLKTTPKKVIQTDFTLTDNPDSLAKDEFRGHLGEMFCHKTSAEMGCLDDDTLKGKRPSEAFIPGFFPGNMKYTLALDEMKLEARIPNKEQPWSDDYWAIDRGVLAHRYAGESGYDWESSVNYVLSEQGHLSYILNLPESEKYQAIDGLSPAEKYDLIIGTITADNYAGWLALPRPLEDEIYVNGMELQGKVAGFLAPNQWIQGQYYFDSRGEVESWMGICHGWSTAAIQMPRPLKPVDVLSADATTWVRFYPAEIKALGSYLWAQSAPRSRFIGGRCNSKEVQYDELSGAILDENLECFDTNPKDWHTIVTNYIGGHQRSFVMDVTFDYEVWNQPVLGYEYRFFRVDDEQQKPVDSLKEALVEYKGFKDKDIFRNVRRADPSTKYIVGVMMEVQYLVENTPRQYLADSYERDNITEAYYTYDLELNEDLEIVGGEWHEESHPDFLWVHDAEDKAISDREKYSGYNYADIKAAVNFNKPLHPTLQDMAQKASKQGEVLGSIIETLFEKAQ